MHGTPGHMSLSTAANTVLQLSLNVERLVGSFAADAYRWGLTLLGHDGGQTRENTTVKCPIRDHHPTVVGQ